MQTTNIGQCILIQGDCLDVFARLIHREIKVDAVIADPPYAVLNKKCSWDSIIDIGGMWDGLDQLKKTASTPIILFSQEPYTSQLIMSNRSEYKYKWYWQKTSATGHLNAKKQPMRCIEEICVFYAKQPIYNPQKTQGHKPVNSYTKTVKTANNTVCYGETTKEVKGGGNTDRYPRQLLTFPSDKQTCKLHPTQKPLALMEYLVKTYTNENDVVLDFTAGSFTTGVACQNTNRKFIGIELDEQYYEIGVERMKENQERLDMLNISC